MLEETRAGGKRKMDEEIGITEGEMEAFIDLWLAAFLFRCFPRRLLTMAANVRSTACTSKSRNSFGILVLVGPAMLVLPRDTGLPIEPLLCKNRSDRRHNNYSQSGASTSRRSYNYQERP